MKAFIGLVLGVIAVGLILTAAAAAFLFGVSTEEVVMPVTEMGLTDLSAEAQDDALGILVSWRAITPDSTTFVIQRSTTQEDDDWQDIAVIEPGSSHFVDGATVEYLDEDVEHMQEYAYRIQMTDADGGSGMTWAESATAVDPSR